MDLTILSLHGLKSAQVCLDYKAECPSLCKKTPSTVEKHSSICPKEGFVTYLHFTGNLFKHILACVVWIPGLSHMNRHMLELPEHILNIMLIIVEAWPKLPTQSNRAILTLVWARGANST